MCMTKIILELLRVEILCFQHHQNSKIIQKVINIHFKLHTESISFARIVSFGDPIPWPIFYSCKLTPLSCHGKLYDLDLTKMLKSFFDYNNIHYNVFDGPFKNY